MHCCTHLRPVFYPQLHSSSWYNAGECLVSVFRLPPLSVLLVELLDPTPLRLEYKKNRHSIYAETTVVPLTWCQQLVLPFPLLANSLGREALLFLLRPSNLGDVENELKIENTMGAVSELII